MLLVIDVGNTETVFGLYKQKTLQSHWRMSSRSNKSADECWILLKSWMGEDHYKIRDIKGIAISSVVPSLTRVLRWMTTDRFGIEPLVISADTDTGMKVLYDSPRDVGSDRICNAVAGFNLYGGPLIIVDFGTATTFDIISARGEYIGGAIALGLQGASQELHRLAAKLPKVELAFPAHVAGSTTEESMQSGIMWGTVAMIDGLIGMIREEMGWKEVRVIGTGGVAELLAGKSKTIEKVDPFLTLEGIRLIHERIKG